MTIRAIETGSLNFLVKSQLAVEKLRVATQVRNTHLRKKQKQDKTTEQLEEELKKLESFVDKVVAEKIENHPAYPWFSRVKGIGKENIAKVVGLIDIVKAPHVSSLWKFAGFAPEDGKSMRPEKGHKLGYNAELRSMCWRLGRAIIRAQSGPTPKSPNRKEGEYYKIYIKRKKQEELKVEHDGLKIVPSARLPKRNGKKYEPEGVISLGHVDNRAERWMIKIVLQHLWVIWRKALKLPVTEPYAMDKLKHNHYYDPWEFVDK